MIRHLFCFLFWFPAFLWRLFICTAVTSILILFSPILFCAACEEGRKWACEGQAFRLFGIKDIKDFSELMRKIFIDFLIKGKDFPDA